MKQRLPLILSLTALVISVLGSTPLGRAAVDAVIPVPLAKRAYLADTAKNSVRLNNIRASRTPTPGMLLPLGADGKLPPEIGAVGPQGPQGSKGSKGDKGKDGAKNIVIRMSQPLNLPVGALSNAGASCEKGERAVGGGAGSTDLSSGGLDVIDGRPSITGPDGNQAPATPGSIPTGWQAGVRHVAGYGATTWAVYVICVSP